MTDYQPDTVLRHRALALRDFAELMDVDKASFTLAGVTILWTPEGGFRVTSSDGAADINDWVDQPGLVPA